MLTVAAQDIGRQRSAPAQSLRRGLRYVELARPVIQAKAGTRFGVRVLADATVRAGGFARKAGTAKPGLLVLRAPTEARAVPARRLGRPAQRPRDRRRGAAMSTAAHAGGPLAAAGLALLILGPEARASGWPGSSPGSPAARCSPSTSRRTGTRRSTPARRSSARSARSALAALFRRWPWLIAVSALACAPARIPVHVGSTDSNLLVPLYAVVAGAAVLLGWELIRGDDALAGARPARLAARPARRAGAG